MVLNDNQFSGSGCPSRSEFRQYGIEHITSTEFKNLQDSLKKGLANPGDIERNNKFALFFKQWTEDNRKKIKKQIDSILTLNDVFPKKISALYDDRKQKHMIHIVLEFTSKDNCILHIDNTTTFAHMLPPALRASIKKNEGIDVLTAKEDFSDKNPKCIRFTSGSKSIDIEFSAPITQILQDRYSRMISMLKLLGIPVKNVVYKFSLFNQKLTDECVPFALQNKSDFSENKKCGSNEQLFETATRLRAEQALLGYLLNDKAIIPHLGEDDSADLNLNYPTEEWYPNYYRFCEALNQKISELSFQELNQLYMSIDIDDSLRLADSFKPFIFSCMNKKRDLTDYDELCDSTLTSDLSLELEEVLAPAICYQQNKFFIKKSMRDTYNMSAFFTYLGKKEPQSSEVREECPVSDKNPEIMSQSTM